MDVNTAGRVLGIDKDDLKGETRTRIIQMLRDDEAAIGLIAENIADFKEALGRDVNVKEATFGHNAGIESLKKNLPIEKGSSISRRSIPYQRAIADALEGKVDATPDVNREIFDE